MKRTLQSLIILLVGWAASSTVSAVPLVSSWAITGPGTITSTQAAANEWDLDYSLNPAGYSTVEWNVSTTAAANGNYEFDWNYSGFHAFFNVTAYLVTSGGTTLYSAGPNNCCTPPSGGFNEYGNYVFSGVTAGDTFGFKMGGSNFDSNNTLSGNLNLKQVNAPEPTMVALLGLGLLGFSVRRRNIN